MQGSHLIVEHLDQPLLDKSYTAQHGNPDSTHSKPQWQTEQEDDNNMTMQIMDITWHHQTAYLNKHTGNPQHTQASLTCNKKKTTLPAVTRTQHIRTNQMVISKIQTGPLTLLNGTQVKKAKTTQKDLHMCIKWHP
jgi:hypothetical protein